MDRSLATNEVPLLNRGEPYVPDAGRTYDDDNSVTFDTAGAMRQRTHISQARFETIYRDAIRYFAVQEKFSYKRYQAGELTRQQFYKECGQYLKRNFPDEMNLSEDDKKAGKQETWDFQVMMNRLNVAVFGYDVLQPLIDNEETSDIKVCGPDDIRVRVKGKAYQSNACFFDTDDLCRFVEGIAIRNHVDIYSYPVLTFTDVHDENYILRFTVSNPSVCAVDHPYLHIRKVPKDKPDFDELIRRGMLNEDVKLYLKDRAKTSRGVVFSGPPGCVDAKTEFFNGSEWKPISEYQEGEMVLQFDTETNEASLVVPNEYIKLPCDEMYHFENERGIDQTLSEEHRVLYYKRNSKGEKIPKIITAGEMFDLLSQRKFEGQIRTSFCYFGEGIDLSDDEIKLMCAIICDGTFDTRKEHYNKCTLNLKKERKISEARAILNRLGIPYTEHAYANGYVRFRFEAPRKEKVFSCDWYKCTNHQLQVICDNIIQWDGNVNAKTGHKSFSSSVKENVDFIQFAFASCGYRANVFVNDRTNQPHKNGYKRKSKEYIVSISRFNYVGISNKENGKSTKLKMEKVRTKDGFKYCFTVPKDTLVLRRNGKIFVTKNSGKTTALNAFIEFIPRTRETLVIQENDELNTKQPGFMFKHVSNGFQGEPICTLEDLARIALVEGCNEFVIGEVKGGEMRYAMTLVNAGGYAALTVHSNDVYEIHNKLADLVKYGSDYSFEEARRMLQAFDTLVYMEGYKVRAILECEGYDDATHQYKYVPIYRYSGD